MEEDENKEENEKWRAGKAEEDKEEKEIRQEGLEEKENRLGRELEEDRKLEKRKEKIKSFLTKKTLLVCLGLVILLYLTWHIRTANVNNLKDITTNDYTLGPDLDPFFFLRYAKYIVENGKLMENDIMRNVPLGFDTAEETKLLPYMIAYFHKAISIFSEKSINYSGVMFPVFMFLLTVMAFFLFIRKVFEKNKYKDIIALVSSAFLMVAPSLLPRTVAGIPEKESAVFFFLFLSFYFFLCAWRTDKLKKGLLLALLAGLSTAGMGLIWGGVKYIYLAIGLAVFLEFMIGKVSKKRFFIYSAWVISSFLILLIFFPGRFSLKPMIMDFTSTGFAFMIFFLLLLDFLIFRTKIKDLSLINNLRRKIPDRVFSIIAFIILGVIFSTLLLRVTFVPDSIKTGIASLSRTDVERFSYTVAENKFPYFNDWKNSFDPIVNILFLKNIPLFFWLFFIGSIFLVYKTVEKLRKREKLILVWGYALFLFAFIFSRYSPDKESMFFYFGSYLLLIVSLGYVFYQYYIEGKLEELKRANSSYFLLLAFFFVSLIGARSAIRLIMILAIPAAGIVGFFAVSMVEEAKKQKKKILRYVLFVLALIVVIASLYSFYHNYQETLGYAKSMIPSSYTQQWQKAMAWVRENTEKDAVFAHWWDYGYWLQSIGERATVLDGGNVILYWNHLLGRHVLTGQTEKEALEFLYAHNTSYLLIDSSDIGKYPAFSSIGSDEQYDRYSQIPIFTEDAKGIQETKNEILHIYKGNMFLDKNFTWKNDGVEEILPAYQAGIGGVFLLENKKDGGMVQAKVAFVYQGRQIDIPLRCLFINGQKYDFGTGYPGCLYIAPSLVSREGKTFVEASGNGLFLTEKVMDTLLAKLYLFNETDSFQLVHTEEDFLVKDLENQGFRLNNFVFYGGIRGPIKIWKINYPPDIEFREEYLKTDYPTALRERRENF